MIHHALVRIRAGESMPGLLVVRQMAPIGSSIADILLFVHCYDEQEMDGQIFYLPLQ